MKVRRFMLISAAVILLSLMLGACGGVSQTIRIGIVNPTTGALAGNGEGCEWSVDQIYDYVRENPIQFGNQTEKLEIIVYDSESDSRQARDLAERLARDDKVDLLIAAQTPETVIPVSSVAEEYGIPCIAIQAPVDPIANAREKYEWTYHAFWTIDKVYECYRNLWTRAGYPPDSGARVGTLFADDPDGSAWHEIFVRRLREDGYQVVDPGQYPLGNEDFSVIADIFAESGIDILTGTNQPPDFMNAIEALLARGVEAQCITMGKCCLLEADAVGMGEMSIGLMCEVWWNPTEDTVSELTGDNAVALSKRYAEENFDRKMSAPAAYSYAALELAVHALKNAGTTNKKAIRKAISELDVDTIVGPIRFDKELNGLHYGDTIIGGGQWQVVNGELVLKVIDNTLYPEMKVNGRYLDGNILKNTGNTE